MKKLIALSLILTMNFPAFAQTMQTEQIIKEEYLFGDKKAPSKKVVLTNTRNIICKGNVLKIAFDCKFWSEKSKAGDKISFSFPESIYTQEGTLIIPAGTKVQATVINIEKQKKFDNMIVPNKPASLSHFFAI